MTDETSARLDGLEAAARRQARTARRLSIVAAVLAVGLLAGVASLAVWIAGVDDQSRHADQVGICEKYYEKLSEEYFACIEG